MRRPRGLWQWLGLVSLLLLVALPTTASAATTVRVGPTQRYLVEHLTPLAAPPVVIGAHATLRFAIAPRYVAAGVQGSSPGLQGTTVTLASCGGACTDLYRPASSPRLGANHYAERVTFAVTQPRAAGPAVGFDVQVAIHLSSGWVFGTGYFSTGVSPGAGTTAVTLRLFVDLGTAAPTVLAVEVVVNRCLSTTGCP
ncbi:MAG TPA: hypothetical protein VMH38_04275 [Thermoplasmata archaeon]|nr:hypothetical protein [Thermoplasmata archaeon]